MPLQTDIPINKTGSSNKFPLSYQTKIAILKRKIPKFVTKKIGFPVPVCEGICKKTKIKTHLYQARSGTPNGLFLRNQFLKYPSVLSKRVVYIPNIIIPITVLFVMERIPAGI